MTARMGAQSRLRSLSAQRAAKRQNKSRFSEILARAFSAILAGEDEIPCVRTFPRYPSRAMTITS